jgi:hypothetical protein
MPRSAKKNGRSVAADVRKLRSEIENLESRLRQTKAAFLETDEFDVRDAGDFFDVLLARVEREGERIFLSRGKARVAALVPADEAEFLQQLEDRHDIEEARKALQEPGRIPWEQVKKNLGL